MTARVAIILLAAGASRRMRGRDKLLEDVGDKSLLRRVAGVALASAASEVIVVLGARSDARRDALEGLAVRTTTNDQWQSGMSSSIRSGIEALTESTDAVLILLGDMPDVRTELINRMIVSFDPRNDIDIVRPISASGPTGNPILFGRKHFPALRELTGDVGAKTVIQSNRDSVIDIPTADDGVLTDLDTPEAWAAWRAKN